MATLADYNNNPGNLRPPKGVTYEGQIGIDENGFAVFANKEFGRRALLNDVNAKLGKGIDTPEKFINRYAPQGTENPEEARDNYKLWLAHSLGMKGTKEPFPENAAEKLVDAITQFEGGTWNQKQEAEPQVEKEASPYGPPVANDLPKPTGETESDRTTMGGMTGAVGAGLGTIYSAKAPAVRLAQRVGLLPGGKPISSKDAAALAEAVYSQSAPAGGSARTTAGAAGPAAPGAPSLATYKRAVGPNQAVINYALAHGLTPIEAERALDMTKQAGGVHDLLTKRRETTLGVRERFPSETWRENPTYGGILTQEPSVGGGPRAQYVMRTATSTAPGQPSQGLTLQQLPRAQPVPIGTLPTEPPPVPQSPGGLSVMGRALTSAPVRGGLAGYGFGSNVQEAYEKAMQGDVLGAAISGVGAGGSLLSLVPGRVSPIGAVMSATPDVVTRAKEKDYLGAGISGGSALASLIPLLSMSGPQGIALATAIGLSGPVINAMRDYQKKLSKQGPQEPQTMPATDAMGNPVGAYP